MDKAKLNIESNAANILQSASTASPKNQAILSPKSDLLREMHYCRNINPPKSLSKFNL